MNAAPRSTIWRSAPSALRLRWIISRHSGVAANRLSTISYGEEIPVCKENNEDCWAKNRRARFVTSAAKPVS